MAWFSQFLWKKFLFNSVETSMWTFSEWAKFCMCTQSAWNNVFARDLHWTTYVSLWTIYSKVGKISHSFLLFWHDYFSNVFAFHLVVTQRTATQPHNHTTHCHAICHTAIAAVCTIYRVADAYRETVHQVKCLFVPLLHTCICAPINNASVVCCGIIWGK